MKVTSNSNGLPLKDLIRKLTSRIEAVENFISSQFGKDALNREDTFDSFSGTNLSTESDHKRKSLDNQNSKSHKYVKVNKRKTSPSVFSQATWKRTRSCKQISYKEDEESNSERETEPNDNNDYDTLLVPKTEVEDPSYDLQVGDEINYFDGIDGSGEEEELGGEDDDTNTSWSKERRFSGINTKSKNSSSKTADSAIPRNKDAPWMQEDYVPPTLLPAPGSKRSNCLVLAFRDHTYSLDSKCKITVGTRKEKNKKTWKCSIGGGDSDRCKARMYTWGPEYKVLGFWGEHNHPPRTEKIETRIFMDKLKKIAMTTDLSISDIVDNGLKEATEKTKSLLPDVRTIRRILNCVRRPMSAEKPNRLTTPCFNHLINKLKQGELSIPKDKNDLQNSDSSKLTNSSFLSSHVVYSGLGPSSLTQSKVDDSNNLKSSLSETSGNESDIMSLLIPKTEIVSYDGCQNEDDCESADMNSMDAEIENDNVFEDDCTPNENDLNAPCMQEGYEPPFLLEKGSTKRLLVYAGYTYALRARHKNTLDECSGVVIRERRESEKKIWRCSLSNANRDHPINCGATIYTWGPEYKVLGSMGEHSHPPRTEEIKKRIFLDKLKEIARTTDTPINEIIDEALRDATEDLKSVLPKVETIKCHLRIARNEIKPHVVNRLKITHLAKQMSGSGTADNKTGNILTAQTKGMLWGDIASDAGQFAQMNRETGNNVQANFNSNLTEESTSDDSGALWMKDDYLPPTVLPSKASASGRVNSIVLAFKGHIYCADYKCKQSDLAHKKERDKINWKCNFAGGGNSSIEGERCKARIYTWGPEYKVLGMWGEHNHPQMTEKIERRIFMEKLKKIAATTETPIPEIVSDALSETSEEFKETLPKLESIYQILRKIRYASFGKPNREPNSDGPTRKLGKSKTKIVTKKVKD